jgi:hypothetical protein
MFHKQVLSKLDRRAYKILESILIEEIALKDMELDGSKRLKSNDECRADEIRNHRRGKVALIWALKQFHRLLTHESFWAHHSHNPIKARPALTQARG